MPAGKPGEAPAYRRILLKISGEALMGSQPFGIDEPVVVAIADEVGTSTRSASRSPSSSAAATSSAAWPPATAASTG